MDNISSPMKTGMTTPQFTYLKFVFYKPQQE